MRFCVSNNRIAALSRVSSIALLGGLIAGCSSGFQRFDTTLYETAVPQQTAQVENPYPGGVDNLTTASTPKRFAPLADVAPRQVPQGVYHNPEPVYVAPQSSAVYAPKPYEPYTLPQPQNYTPAAAGQTYSQSALPKAEVTTPVAAYAPPKPEIAPQPVYIPQPKTDPVNTAAVQAVTPRTTQDGWSSAGGTTIAVSQGETLYNISKRYGVPVSAIRSVNGMSPSADLRAGQNITIPNYVFTKTSGVSAPDNDPTTRAARASTGYYRKKQRYVPKTHVSPPEKDTTPDYSVVTGSVQPNSTGVYKVQSGDSLSRIASRNGTTVSALQAANGMNGTNLRIGQTLKLPTGVDPGQLKPTSIDKDTPAPARTGISDFRWPVKGRVVSNFGESGSNGSNEGIDISVPEGTAVHAAENGLILVRHTDDWVSAYAHNRDYEVKKGDNVRRGQIIARSGRTG
ncbi:putative lipoprotein YgeR [Nymphon striatum]|nr:putative lipoprotein YgeR [Nymphon striatum]